MIDWGALAGSRGGAAGCAARDCRWLPALHWLDCDLRGARDRRLRRVLAGARWRTIACRGLIPAFPQDTHIVRWRLDYTGGLDTLDQRRRAGAALGLGRLADRRGLLTLAAIYASFSLQTCFGGLRFRLPAARPLAQALIFVGYLACPVAALVYGVYGARPFGRRARRLPDGLTVSSLHTVPADRRDQRGGCGKRRLIMNNGHRNVSCG